MYFAHQSPILIPSTMKTSVMANIYIIFLMCSVMCTYFCLHSINQTSASAIRLSYIIDNVCEKIVHSKCFITQSELSFRKKRDSL